MSVSAVSNTSTTVLQNTATSGVGSASGTQGAASSTAASSTTASSVAATTIAPAISSPGDAVAQQIAQYTAILNDTSGAYSLEQQSQTLQAVSALLGSFSGTGLSAVWRPGGLSEADNEAVVNALTNTAFGAEVQSIGQTISKAEFGGDVGGLPADWQNPSAGLQKGFESLSDTDKQIYLDLDSGGKAYDGWSVSDYDTNLQANTELQGYIETTEKADKVTDAEIDAGKIDPTLKAAFALESSSETLGFADSVNSFFNALDSATSATTQAAVAYAAPGSSTAAANASIAAGKKALASLTSAPATVSKASVALTVLQNAAANNQASASSNKTDAKSDRTAANSGEANPSNSAPYTQGSLVSATA